MKLLDSLLLSGSVGVFIIGVHQTFTMGLMNSYWLFMLCIVFLLLYKVRKGPAGSPGGSPTESPDANPAGSSVGVSGQRNKQIAAKVKPAKAARPPKKEKH